MIFTNKAVSPVGEVNPTDLRKIARDTAIFLIPVFLIYLSQLQGGMNSNGIITLKDMAPTAVTIGAIETWVLGILTNIVLKLSNGSSK